MIESKSIVVSPEKEQDAVNDYQLFGWTLTNSQEVRDTNTTIENDFDDIYVVTRRTNYVKLLFQRDRNMANYSEICKLERTYFEGMSKFRNNFVTVFPNKFVMIPVIGCIIAGIGNMTLEHDYGDGILWILIGIVIFTLRTLLIYLPRNKRSKEGFHKAYEAKEAAKRLL